MSNKHFDHFNCFRPLCDNHQSGLLFCWRVREGIKLKVTPQRIARYISYFWSQNLNPHFKEEEALLLGDPSNPVVEKALRDHLLLYNKIQRVINRSEPASADELADLVNLLDTHIQFEERKLFPYLRNVFTHEQLKQINTCLQENTALHDIKSQYYDEFWKNEKSSL
ncbi:MAG: hemerythrin domain-containing protein [Chitinophagaceae bacterium]|nr:hemerythrin domain-containing protein [Chitinophagaceae bacterium]